MVGVAGSDPERRTAGSVRAEQIRTLYRQSVWIMAVNPINATVVTAVMWPSGRGGLLVGWVAAMAALTLVRARVRARYLALVPPLRDGESAVWGRRFVAGAMTAGALWGLGGAFFFDPHAVAAQLILLFVVAGMVAGAAGTLATYLPAFIAYAGAALAPLAVRIMAEDDRLHAGMGALVVIFGLALGMVATNTHRSIAEAFRLRFDKQDLLDRLSRAQTLLQESNRTLEERVAERGAALEKQTEALREAQRMESVGLLAGGVAHDFNNLLTVVLGNVQLLLDGAYRHEDLRMTLEEVRGAANRGAMLVSQLLAFSRRQVMVPRVLDMNAVVSETQRLLERLIGEHIQLVVTMQVGPLFVKSDPTQLHQVIINLATNGRDAMAAGGRLTIETELAQVPEGGIPGAPAVPAGTYVVLSVRDTGVGMDAQTRRMVFHPFFTTKEVGRGTGLGLATVYGIVEQSGGWVVVESEPGQGSCFRVFLPQVPAETTAAVAPPATAALVSSHLHTTVLIVEDEPLVRGVTARILRGAGYRVVDAPDGERALDLVAAHEGHIDLLLTDVVMARMGGFDLANRLTAERPGLAVLFVSGYSPDSIPVSGDTAALVGFLQKPFTPDELLQAVSRVLSGVKPPPLPESDPAARDPGSPVMKR